MTEIFPRRMDYSEAIVYLKEHNITKDDGTFYEYGEVSYKYYFMTLIAFMLETGK